MEPTEQHEVPATEPAEPPARSPRVPLRSWAPQTFGLAGLALVAIGAQALTIEASLPRTEDDLTGTNLMAALKDLPGGTSELPGPPVPTREVDGFDPTAEPETEVASAAVGGGGVTASGTGTGGHIGYMGPISGALNTNLEGVGPVFGPQWERKPLPGVIPGVLGSGQANAALP
jgi:hypothetical protein